MTDIIERLDVVQVRLGANAVRDCETIEDAKTEIETLRTRVKNFETKYGEVHDFD